MIIPSLADVLNASPLVPSTRWEQGNGKHLVKYCFGPDTQQVTAGFCAKLRLAYEPQRGEEVYIAIAPVRYLESERFRTGETYEDGTPIEKYRDVEYYVTLVVTSSRDTRAFKGKSYKCYNDLTFIGEKVKEAYDEYVSFQQSITLE